MHPVAKLRNVSPAAAQAAPPVLTRWMDAEGRRFALRPLAPQDAVALGLLWDAQLSAMSRRNRFHGARGGFTPQRLAQATAPGTAWVQAFAVVHIAPGGERLLAEARWVRSPDAPHTAELALSVADEWQAQGLGRRLLKALVDSAHQQGLQTLTAKVLRENKAMRALLFRTGFELDRHDKHSRNLSGNHVSTYVSTHSNPHSPEGDALAFTAAVPALLQPLQRPLLAQAPCWPRPGRVLASLQALHVWAAALLQPQAWPRSAVLRNRAAL